MEVEGYIDTPSPIYITDMDQQQQDPLVPEHEEPLAEKKNLAVSKDDLNGFGGTPSRPFPLAYTEKVDTLKDGTYKLIVAEEKFSTFEKELQELKGEIISKEMMTTEKSYEVHCRW